MFAAKLNCRFGLAQINVTVMLNFLPFVGVLPGLGYVYAAELTRSIGLA